MKKKLLALALTLGLGLTLAACSGGNAGTATPPKDVTPATGTPATEASDSDMAYVQGKGKMTIGYTVYAPMNYTDESGSFTGFDTELATAVSEKLGVEAEFVLINWDTKEVELAAKSIDCIWNGMTITPDREANMACTQPYVKNSQVVVMKVGSGYTDTASLIGQTVVAEIGSAGEEQIKGEGADASLAQADYVGKGVQTDCLMEVKAGTASAAVLDMTLANAMIGADTNYDDLEIVDYLAEESYGVGFRKDSDLRDAVNGIFDEMTADGSLKAIADKYGLELAD